VLFYFFIICWSIQEKCLRRKRKKNKKIIKANHKGS